MTNFISESSIENAQTKILVERNLEMIENKDFISKPKLNHTVDSLNNSFRIIFIKLNSCYNGYFRTVEILSGHVDIIREAIKFFRDSNFDARFDLNLHTVDKRYVGVLLEKKLSKFFEPAFCFGEGNCLFRAVSQAVFGTQDFHMVLRICSAFVLITHIEYFEKNSTWNSICKKNGTQKMKQHIASIAMDKVYGGEDEQSALSFIFKKPVLVLSSFCTVEYNPLVSKRDPIVLYFDFKGEHFTTLMLKKNVNFIFDFIRPENTVIQETMIDTI